MNNEIRSNSYFTFDVKRRILLVDGEHNPSPSLRRFDCVRVESFVQGQTWNVGEWDYIDKKLESAG